ncbi:Uracil phosphoribosyltransferase [uncultured Alphaproteobacteria bacterium]|uniref:Uracil phosphoribosyltransferase n=1 Tax=uncultured Alphaproteobacteria bacterium TaxID=91750 RepID=A0A212IXP0_9PROT|nr:Uracil phosphoribosyltransferase [uncultured Alphaproteobacteria bacterium]
MAETPSVIVVDHPLVRHKLTRLRDRATPTAEFRTLMREVGALLAIEATRHLPLAETVVQTPLAATRGWRLDPIPAVIPILRAGLGLADGLLDLLPEADVGHLGMYRDEETVRPVPYLERLPADLGARGVVVVDPMLATGHSAAYALDLLVSRGARPEATVLMALVAAPEGVAEINRLFPAVRIVTAALDERLNEKSYIVPGLGDAGDRLYGTP